MIRTLNTLNFVLLLVVGGLCIFQWSREKDYARRLSELQQTTGDQKAKLAEQAEAVQHAQEDLEGFRGQVATLSRESAEQTALIREHKGQIFSLEAERTKLSRQAAASQQTLDEYKTAINGRDENIRTLLRQREQLVAANKDAANKANQAIAVYNDLIGKYENVVSQYNALVASQTKDTRPSLKGNAP